MSDFEQKLHPDLKYCQTFSLPGCWSYAVTLLTLCNLFKKEMLFNNYLFEIEIYSLTKGRFCHVLLKTGKENSHQEPDPLQAIAKWAKGFTMPQQMMKIYQQNKNRRLAWVWIWIWISSLKQLKRFWWIYFDLLSKTFIASAS